MKQILDTTDATSSVFRATTAENLVLLLEHAGGTWKLEVQAPSGTWLPTDGGSFTVSGDFIVEVAMGLKYRLSGGTVGAKAWVGGRTGGGVEIA